MLNPLEREIGGGEAAGTVAGLDFEVLDCFAD